MADVVLGLEDAVTLVEKAFKAASVSEINARSVARALVAAEVDGQAGHGLSRVAAYAAQAKSGKVNGYAEPLVEKPAPAFLRIDACNGFAFPAIELAIDRLVDVTAETGIAAAAITRSHHCGQLGAHVERLADAGCIGLMFANTPKAMAPWGGRDPLFGTNPIAFAAPRRGAVPLLIDLSLSRVARGKIMAAGKSGSSIPEGWALDSEGLPTTDPKAALSGSMIPAGDAKGAALALMVEILVAGLSGSNFSFEASSFFDADGPPPGVGQLLIAINPDSTGSSSFWDRLELLCLTILEQEGTRLPGDGRMARREACKTDGLVIPGHLHREISALLEPGS